MGAVDEGGPTRGPGRAGQASHHAIIERFERASPDELERMLASPTIEQERALRPYLGDDRYRRMHELAVMHSVTRSGRSAQAPRGNVVILPGLMGSALHAIDRRGNDQEVWLSLWNLARGRIGRLRLGPDGILQADPSTSTRTGNVLWKYYGELVLAMRRHWRVLVFPYDWRKDIRLAADALLASINANFGPDEPVHLVAHSMGGLVARSFLQRHAERWRSMWSAEAERQGRGGRLVMLGTPNHGSYLVPQVLCGVANTVGLVSRLDLTRNLAGLLGVVHSFPGLYQLLPSPIVDRDAPALYAPETYGSIGVSSRHLALAAGFHEELARPLDADASRRDLADRMIYFAGIGQETPDGIAPGQFGHLARVPQPRGFDITQTYSFTFEGDGSVSRRLGQLRDRDGRLLPVRTFTVRNEHSAMLSNANVLDAVDEVLRFGDLRRAATRGAAGAAAPAAIVEQDWSDPADAPGLEPRPDPLAASRWAESRERQRLEYETMVTRVRERIVLDSQRSAGPNGEDAQDDLPPVSLLPSHRDLGEYLLSELFPRPSCPAARPLHGASRTPPTITIRLARDTIAAIGERPLDLGGEADVPPIDAIALGHYAGEKPHRGEPAWELDQALSRALLPPDQRDERRSLAFEADEPGDPIDPGDPRGPVVHEGRRVIAAMIERGLAAGALGHPFFLPDPREPSRLIALCGMGVPGGFGAPELAVLARELIWALGRMGKRHLAAPAIGTRNASIAPAEAAEAWVRGIKLAFSGIDTADDQMIRHLTLVLPGTRLVAEMDRTLRKLQAELGREHRLVIEYEGLSDARLAELERRAIESERDEFAADRAGRRRRRAGPGAAVDPVRMTVRFGPAEASSRRVFRFGAVTRSAALPMREIEVDPGLVELANQELAREFDPARQFERGRFLGQLLLPRDFRPLLRTGGPLVMMLDETSARIHWEMVARPELWDLPDTQPPGQCQGQGCTAPGDSTDWSAFLGTSRGLTRQLITSFGAPPEPPPPSRRYLRVLVVADPAADAPLPGSRREGIATVELLRSFNAAWGHSGNVVEVEALIGPGEATRTNVLRHLMGRTYDALHYAGHAFFDEEDPARSGLLFSDGQVISAHEMRRIDRVPQFVFLNACESGVVPARFAEQVGRYHPRLAPSFAESFFERGVSNLVCTAWPVHDEAATVFSQTLYQELLGLKHGADGRLDPSAPRAIHRAMQAARLAVARLTHVPGGALTWGAYQHYGNPDFAFFDGSRMAREALASSTPAASSPDGDRPRSTASKRPRRKPKAKPGADS